jgi:hypothetical protein
MILRGFCYVVIGWMLVAIVGGLADVLSLTVMLPATSAVILAHVAFSRATTLPSLLAIAIALGYLEDLHQGAPTGTLTMAHALAALALAWAADRLAVTGWATRLLAVALAVILTDALGLAVLLVLADALGARVGAVMASATVLPWHGLATLLVAPSVWVLLDRTFSLLRLDDRPPQQAYWTGK